jgi:hypothetical protein
MSYGSTGFIWESLERTLSSTTTVVPLSAPHPRPPHVTVTAIGDDTSTDGTGATYNPNVNIFVNDVSIESVTIQLSGGDDKIAPGFKVSINAISTL